MKLSTAAKQKGLEISETITQKVNFMKNQHQTL